MSSHKYSQEGFGVNVPNASWEKNESLDHWQDSVFIAFFPFPSCRMYVTGSHRQAVLASAAEGERTVALGLLSQLAVLKWEVSSLPR